MSLISEIPATILRRGDVVAGGALRGGDIAASGALRSGQISSTLFSQLGQIPGQVMQQVQDQKTQQQQQQLRAQQLTEGGLSIKKTQQELADQKAIDEAMRPNADGVVAADRDALRTQLTSAGQGHVWLKLAPILDQIDKDTAERNRAHNDGVAGMAAGVHELGNTPVAFDAAMKMAVANKYIDPQTAQQYTEQATADPTAIPKITADLMARSDKYKSYLADQSNRKSLDEARMASEDARRAAARKSDQEEAARTEERQTTNAATQLANARDAADYARRYQGLPENIRGKFDPPEAFDPKETPKRSRFVGMTPEQQTNALHQEVVDQRENARIAIDRAKETRLEKGGDPSVKAATLAQKAQAERWKAEELEKLEKEFKASQPYYETFDEHGNPTGLPKAPVDAHTNPITRMSVADLNQRKAQIQQSYLAQIGAQGSAPAAAPAAAPSAQPAGRGAPPSAASMPADGQTGVVNGVPAVWRQNGPKGPGWYAQSKQP